MDGRDELMKPVVQRMKSIIQARGLTYSDVAKQCGYSYNYILCIFGGDRYPSLPGCLKFCEVYGIGIDYLLLGKSTPTDVPPLYGIDMGKAMSTQIKSSYQSIVNIGDWVMYYPHTEDDNLKHGSLYLIKTPTDKNFKLFRYYKLDKDYFVANDNSIVELPNNYKIIGRALRVIKNCD